MARGVQSARIVCAATVVALCVAAPRASAEAVNACFSAHDLKSKPGERAVRHGDGAFDDVAASNGIAATTPIAAAMRGAIRSVSIPSGEKVVALTFDLCERRGEIAGYDGAIFDYLRREGVKATIFAGGKWLRSHEERAGQLIADPLFEIGNHGDLHRNLRALDAAAMGQEISGPRLTFAALQSKLAAKQCVGAAPAAKAMRLFRFPFGACSPAALDAVNDAGLLAIQWDVSTGDPDRLRSARQIATAIVANARPGAIIIAHANGRGWNTAAALAIAIPKLKASGYRFATVSDLLALGAPVVTRTCYNARPGDTDRYDFLLARRAGGSKAKIRAVRATAGPRKSSMKKL